MRLPSQSLTMVLMLVASVATSYLRYLYDTQGHPLWAMGGFIACLFLTVSLSALYAIYKARNPLWGLLGITGVLGVLVLWFLPPVAKSNTPAKPDKSSGFQA